MQLLRRTSDGRVLKVAPQCDPVTGATVETLTAAEEAALNSAWSAPVNLGFGVTMGSDRTFAPVLVPDPPDPAAIAAINQRTADAVTLLNSTLAMASQANRDALARTIGVVPLTIPLTQLAATTDIQFLPGALA